MDILKDQSTSLNRIVRKSFILSVVYVVILLIYLTFNMSLSINSLIVSVIIIIFVPVTYFFYALLAGTLWEWVEKKYELHSFEKTFEWLFAGLVAPALYASTLLFY